MYENKNGFAMKFKNLKQMYLIEKNVVVKTPAGGGREKKGVKSGAHIL
jgi:hypothetical protein